jgi:hypothetical protein
MGMGIVMVGERRRSLKLRLAGLGRSGWGCRGGDDVCLWCWVLGGWIGFWMVVRGRI